MKEILKNKNLTIGILITILSIVFIFRVISKETAVRVEQTDIVEKMELIEKTSTVKVDDLIINVEKSVTQEETAKGLSGRASLDKDSGMLFIFPKADRYSFWMPDMNFPIDIIWIDENKNIVEIDENVSPKFNPKDPLIYRPNRPIKYVLEVNALFAKKNNIKVGEKIYFD